MIKKLTILLLFVFLISGCVIEQRHEIGADRGKDQAYNDLGIESARKHEGILSDMMIPDDAPGREGDKTGEIIRYGRSTEEDTWHEKRDRRFGSGDRLWSRRPMTIRQSPQAGETPYFKEGTPGSLGYEEPDVEMKMRLLQADEIDEAYVVEKEGHFFVGVQSHEDDKRKVHYLIYSFLSDVVDEDQLHIFTDRKSVNRIRAAEKGEGRFESHTLHDFLKDIEYEFQRPGENWPY
ncbi:YhcN/YlaJ family sporulation lipoprotein [Bacillus sp. FJAT-44742]|uniref:YhcN/YlaJ family sporulation lipoprotein n=1 Tax=Bacillus sp. FJAT-44742 TaxID=2014005 RepID=UPI000C241D70|nr:YhcN/YlaJ family sporulation lipoprotein [Bacillus sp. FJAT-44742]